ncbi:MAG: hypothetical protein JWM19_2706 [Actinomycetia bacterium]|nr:hypothetical protein [Actinomycetes bacterium]
MRRVLVVAGFLPLILFGGLGALSHKGMFWAVGAGIAVAFWVVALASAAGHRRAVRALSREQDQARERHAVELARHDEATAAWNKADAERVAVAPRWLGVRAREGVSRLDVFGGSLSGRRTMLAGLGQSLLERHAVIVLDLSQERVCEGLIAAARQAGLSYQDYQLPRDLRETPLLSGLTGEQVASQVVEVLHADSHGASTVSRATDLMVARKVIRALAAPGGAASGEVTMARVHDALVALLAGSPEVAGTVMDGVAGTAGGEVAGGVKRALAAEFPGDFRKEVAGSLVRLAAVVEPLRDLGADAAPRSAARLTCLSLAEGPRDVTADLTAALVVQWVTQAVVAAGAADLAGSGGSDGGPRPAVVLAGADEQATRHLARLTAACERYDVPLIRTFSRLTEESARHLDTRNTAFMRLATRTEALRAVEHIGMERSFVAGRFTRSRSVSQSRTTTRGESVTHTTGFAQGEAVTKTTGTTEGESLSETVIQRHNDRAHEGRDRQGQDRDDNSKRPPAGNGRNVSGDPPQARAAAGRPGGRRDSELRDRDSSDEDMRGRVGASKNGKARPERTPARGGSSGGGGGGKQKPYVFDFMTSRTKHKFTHQSEAKTESWTRTDETSRTRTRESSKTDGTSVGDAITYELTYDHKVAPETLMDLPEDQMLAPQVAEGRSAEGKGVAGQGAGSLTPGQYAGGSLAGPAESKMIALVVDPAVVGSESVAHVQSHEIPAYQPPDAAIGPGR